MQEVNQIGTYSFNSLYHGKLGDGGGQDKGSLAYRQLYE